MLIIDRCSVRRILAIVGALAAICVIQTASAAPWTVVNSVEAEYFVEGAEGVISLSPDRHALFVVTRKGDLLTNLNIYRIHVLTAETVKSALRGVSPPALTLEFRSSTNTPAIQSARWDPKSNAIEMIATDSSGIPQAFRWDLPINRLTQLTESEQPVVSFANLTGTGSVIYAVSLHSKSAVTDRAAVFLDRQNFGDLVMGLETASLAIYVRKAGQAAFEIGPVRRQYGNFVPEFLPTADGDGALVRWIVHPRDASTLWGSGTNRTAKTALKLGAVMSEMFFWNDKSGAFQTVSKFPLKYDFAPSTFLWNAQARRVVVSGAFLPQSSAEAPVNRWFTVALDPQNGGTSILCSEAFPLSDRLASTAAPKVSAGREQGTIELAPPNANPTECKGVFGRRGNGWRRLSRTPPRDLRNTRRIPPADTLANGIKVQIEQSANAPARLTAKGADAERILIDTADAATTAARATVVDMAWTSKSSGKRFNGGLILPRGNLTRPVPLVIQVYDFDPSIYLPDGAFPTAYAAQPLASAGIAVLLIHNGGVPGTDPRDAGSSVVDCIDSAVDDLVSRGVVDAGRVGLVGFSNGGYNVIYALTHGQKTQFAAAVVADAHTGSYGWYLYYWLGAGEKFGERYAQQFYSGSLWQSKGEWLSKAPSFNIDKIQAPLLMQMTGGDGGLLADLELFAGLHINKKSTDYLYLPGSPHELVQPRHRFASLSATVDWMTFWLMDRENDAPAKRDQYERWRSMRPEVTR